MKKFTQGGKGNAPKYALGYSKPAKFTSSPRQPRVKFSLHIDPAGVILFTLGKLFVACRPWSIPEIPIHRDCLISHFPTERTTIFWKRCGTF